MSRATQAVFIVALTLFAPRLLAQQAVLIDDEPTRGGKRMQAVRIAQGVHVDGRLDEPAWANARFVSDFRQKEPVEGGTPSVRTEVAIVYDDEAIYVAARLHSDDPASIARSLSRRDGDANAERLVVSFDTYHDRRTAYSFGVSAGGVRSDVYHPSDAEWDTDLTFNPVWAAGVALDSTGWSAEMRIPLSQLRFNPAGDGVWGVNVHRFIPTTNEDIYWVYVPRSETGWASWFGQLVGLDDLRPVQRLEIMPYVAGDGTVVSPSLVTDGDPFQGELGMSARIGADAKIGFGSNLTLDATVNPDFGQVDADPAEVNLSAFETFFDERRPFFTEGNQLFQGTGPGYFYSRRIGRTPRGEVEGDFVDAPAQTTILGAAKLTGRLPGGVSLGAVAAVTDNEFGRAVDVETGIRRRTRVEPLTTYGAARLQQEFGAAGSTVGAAVTAVYRSLDTGDPLAAQLGSDAYAGGLDWNLRFRGGGYELFGYAGGSLVRGTPAAIAELQTSSTHYFQRPDQDHVAVDSSRTSLRGLTGAVGLRKNTGRWLWYTRVTATTPGFDINDAGRLRRADEITAQGSFWYRETRPGPLFRTWAAGVFSNGEWNGGGVRRGTRIGGWASGTLRNYVNGWANLLIGLGGLDDEMTRGGPLVGIGGFWNVIAGLFGNPNRPITWRTRVSLFNNPRSDWEGWDGSVGATLQPGGRWTLLADLSLARSTRGRQYVTTEDNGPAATAGSRYVLSRVSIRDLALQIRATYAFSPDLTLELYAEPFVASRRFFGFGEVPAPGAVVLREYGANGIGLDRREDGDYVVTDGPDVFTIGNPDFTSLSFRSNLVLRWEWRPGSTLFVVWQQNRSDDLPAAEGVHPGRLLRSLAAPGENVIAVKLSYWIG